jgi:signal peptidase I
MPASNPPGKVQVSTSQSDDARRGQLPDASVGDAPLAEEERLSLARTFGGRSALRELLETILLAVIVFLVLNAITGRYQVRGPSMTPTLEDGQYMVVGKLSYWFRPPQRGDIVVLLPPSSPHEDYIKRIVGLPGETIEVRDGQAWVNGVAVQEPYVASPMQYAGVWTLRADEYFVLGDNRANSSDSHTWGVLPRRNIVGKAWLTYWPPAEWALAPHFAFAGAEPAAEE